LTSSSYFKAYVEHAEAVGDSLNYHTLRHVYENYILMSTPDAVSKLDVFIKETRYDVAKSRYMSHLDLYNNMASPLEIIAKTGKSFQTPVGSR
jgi:hypothetical protein